MDSPTRWRKFSNLPPGLMMDGLRKSQLLLKAESKCCDLIGNNLKNPEIQDMRTDYKL